MRVSVDSLMGRIECESPYAEGGLAVTPRLLHSGAFRFDRWMITHVASGRSLHGWIDLQCQADAVAIIQRILPLTDWESIIGETDDDNLSGRVKQIMLEYDRRDL